MTKPTFGILVVLIIAGCGPQPPAVIESDAPAKESPALVGQPDGYPDQISVGDVITVTSKLTLSGQGCGVMTWEDKWCGMFVSTFNERPKTPWCDEPVQIREVCAQGEKENFLVSVQLDDQEYTRDNRHQTHLRWTRDLRKQQKD